MKFSFVFAALSLVFGGLSASADTVRMAVTTSFHNSGLADVLLPEIKKDLDIDVQLLIVGTGQAIRLGEAGDVDAILVHAKAAEEAFVASGHGLHRREIMYNDFVLIGPGDDPAAAGDAGSILQAMAQIASGHLPFVSRGDNSGTHMTELSLWQEAGVRTEARDVAWYKEAGAGMGAALNTASGLNAYILSDRASWLKFGNKGALELLYAGDPRLFNQYTYIPVNPARHAHVRSEFALILEGWLLGDRARELIDGYTLEGGRLFIFNGQR